MPQDEQGVEGKNPMRQRGRKSPYTKMVRMNALVDHFFHSFSELC